MFDSLEWLAAMASHIPDNSEQMVHYYGYYSNASRGQRKNARTDEIISFDLEALDRPCMLQPETTDVQFRKTWSRLIQKIYPVEFPEGNPIQPGE